jgi:hypothetical protein
LFGRQADFGAARRVSSQATRLFNAHPKPQRSHPAHRLVGILVIFVSSTLRTVAVAISESEKGEKLRALVTGASRVRLLEGLGMFRAGNMAIAVWKPT